jgi:hypothetical protein
MRSFMVFPPGTVGFYLDWCTQKVGVAAALSDDQVLRDDYLAGDVYHALAKRHGGQNGNRLIDSREEKFVGVPEQGGREMISIDPLAPGSVYTASVDSQAKVGLCRLAGC